MGDKRYEELQFRDDFVFGKVMRKRGLAKKLLETLLSTKIENLCYMETQKHLKVTYASKQVFLDLQMLDRERNFYDVEMQNLNRRGVSETREIMTKRSRYYHSLADVHMLEEGKDYTELRQCNIIYICTFDPFGENRYRYTFDSVCREEPALRLEDERRTIFFNTQGYKQAMEEDLQALLRYIETGEVTDAFTEELETEVMEIKQNEQWRTEYMKELALRMDAIREGRQEGRREGRQEGKNIILLQNVENAMKNLGINEEEACAILGITAEEYQKAKKYKG